MKKTYSYLALAFAPPVIVLAVIAGISAYTGMPVRIFMDDIWGIARMWPYAGILSNIGAFVMCSAAVLCLFTYFTRRAKGLKGDMGLFLLFSGIFSLVFMLDDFFILHEGLIPLFLGIQEIYVLLVYPIAAIIYVLRFAKILRKTEYITLIVAVGFLGASQGFDLLHDIFTPDDSDSLFYRYEDFPKFLGISGWFIYIARTCSQALREDELTVQSKKKKNRKSRHN